MKTGIVKRSSRRFYVVLTGLSYVLLVSFWALANSLANDWLMLPTLLAALTFLYSFSRIFIGTQAWNVANRSAAEADERQRIVRDRAHFWAYLYASIFALLSLTYWYFAGELGWWLPRGYGERTATFWTLLLLIPSLPSAIIAWLEPDPVEDVFEERTLA